MTETEENTNIELTVNSTDEITYINIELPVNSTDEIIDNNIKKKRKNRICLEKGCDKQPNFNTEGQKKKDYTVASIKKLG